MSFISIINGICKSIVRVVDAVDKGVEPSLQLAVPLVTILNPAAGAILGKIGVLISGAEAMVTVADQGALKKQTVAQIAAVEIPQLDQVIAQFGSNVKVPQAELSAAIDASVANYNAIAALVAAIEAQVKIAAIPQGSATSGPLKAN